LTAADPLGAAENKLVQYAAARRLGIRVPATQVAPNLEVVRRSLGQDVLIKPLGPAQFVDESGSSQVVFAQSLPDDVTDDELASAPFLLQERLRAIEHLRVVTVSGRAWCSRLDAAGVPVDWRTLDEAHSSFEYAARPVVESQALQLAAEMNLGYSSQDWIVTDDGEYVLDVNPAGQWLFLPPEAAERITGALADWMSRTPESGDDK
jgi:glutathione synthase/RimK-type ligase-like ATP-grasp enzyme